MTVEPRVVRPVFPEGYVPDPKAILSWVDVERKLIHAQNYWLSTVRPDGRPHSIPKWGVWVDDRFYFDGSPETLHARNITHNPYITLHLESGENVVVLEGKAANVEHPSICVAEQVSAAYREKYASLGYAPQADQWEAGGLFIIYPMVVFAWTNFTHDPTKFIFPEM